MSWISFVPGIVVIFVANFVILCVADGTKSFHVDRLGDRGKLDQTRARRIASSSVCDATITDLETWIFSPNYPSNYENLRACTYTLQRKFQDVCKVEMTLVDFDLEESPGCYKDYLDLGVGANMQKICGALAAETKKTLVFPPRYWKLALRFRSDDQGTRKGFMIQFQQLRNSCNRDIFGPGIGPQGGYQGDRAPDPIMGGTYGKPPFGGGGGQQQQPLPPPPFTGGQKPQAQPPPPFVSGRPSYGGGDYGRPLGGGFGTYGRPGYTTPKGCGGDIRGLAGRLSSPRFPSPYEAGVRCQYTVHRPSSDVCIVEMDVRTFDLEYSTDCFKDYLELPDRSRICGSDTRRRTFDYQTLGRDSMTFSFSSDQSGYGRGFDIDIRQIPRSCGYGPYIGGGNRPVAPSPANPFDARTCGAVSSSSGVLQSGFSRSSEDCYYSIGRYNPNVCRVEIHFSKFDVGGNSGAVCAQDYLDIQGTQYCGKREGQTVVMEFPKGQDELVLRYRTDNPTPKTGFQVQVRQLTNGCVDQPGGELRPVPGEGPSISIPRGGCDQMFREETFQVISPGFQSGAYPDNAECQYTVKKANFEVCALEVTYNAFDLEVSEDCKKDFLEVGTKKICEKLPYQSVRTYQFPSDQLQIRFHSDNAGTGAGFLLAARQITC